MADLVPCTGRSEAPGARTGGRAFVFIPAVFCGSCRAAGRFSLRLPMAQVRQARAVRAGGVPRGLRPEGMRQRRPETPFLCRGPLPC